MLKNSQEQKQHRTPPLRPKRANMAELLFFVKTTQYMLQFHPNPDIASFYQEGLQAHCPHIMQALEAEFLGEWSAMSFTYMVPLPPAFSQETSCGESGEAGREGAQP